MDLSLPPPPTFAEEVILLIFFLNWAGLLVGLIIDNLPSAERQWIPATAIPSLIPKFAIFSHSVFILVWSYYAVRGVIALLPDYLGQPSLDEAVGLLALAAIYFAFTIVPCLAGIASWLAILRKGHAQADRMPSLHDNQ